jgi:hypothetical protein
MKVEAVRDDGSLMITSGPVAAIHSTEGTWVVSRDSALARGSWSHTDVPLPEGLPEDLPERMTAKLAELRQYGPLEVAADDPALDQIRAMVEQVDEEL